MNEPSLLAVLNALPHPAIVLNPDYRIVLANEAYRALYGFSDQPSRHRCYEISHRNTVPCDLAGETCPLKETQASGERTRVLHIHHTPRGEEYVNVELWPVRNPKSGEIEYFIEQMHPATSASVAASAELGRLVGRAESFQQMLALVERVAPSDTSVMLQGESGTGKEVVAQTIHRQSARKEAPFVPVECTGLPDALFESELFGYRKGAFTGANDNKVGLVAAAEGGTLFLDEVGEIPLVDQVKLLRLLETRRYRQIGSNEWVEADFRLVCATHRDLGALVAAGRFREDLFYRLSVFEIELPPLRDRRGDLELLIDNLLQRLQAPNVRFSDAALESLRAYQFPGNVRELRNIVERAILLADNGVVEASHLPRQCRVGQVTPSEGAERELTGELESLDAIEKRYLQHAVRTHQGSRKALAEKLGLSERALYRKLSALRQ